MGSSSNVVSIYPVSNITIPKLKEEKKKKKPCDTCSETSLGDNESTPYKLESFRWFPSYRMMTATMLCLCFASVHMMNSNMGMAMVCMVEENKPDAATTVNTLLKSNISHNDSRIKRHILTTTEIDTSTVSNNKITHDLSETTSTTSAITLLTTNKTKKHNHKSNHLHNSTRHYINHTLLEHNINSSKHFKSQNNLLKRENTKHQFNMAPKVHWSAEDQGWIFGAFNAGLLCMLVTGFMADKFNAKYMIIVSVLMASAANLMIPLMAEYNVRYVMAARFIVGLAEALLQPAINSLVTRWFSSSERSYALGLATGGRQIGTLLIVPTAGALCSQTMFFGGWPSIFYISALTGFIFSFIYILVGADKPSKQSCISSRELRFITIANTSEDMGKKRMERQVPWKSILTSAPVWSALISVVCHEFPLMTMIMFLPSYLHDVHHYHSTKNGILSAIPTACLWISKIGSSYLNTWLQEKTTWETSTISKVLNGVGSVGLAIFMVGTTFLDSSRAWLAVVFLCMSMFFTGMHTPGCQAALVAIAPAFSGAITGLTFFFVAICGMINPAMTKWIVVNGTQLEWNIVFYISTVIALIPVVVFSICGSAEVQKWAAALQSPNISTTTSCPTLAAIISDEVSFTPNLSIDETNTKEKKIVF